MGIELKVYQGDKLAAEGKTSVDQAIVWLVNAFHPNLMANGFSPSVSQIERNRMVLNCAYLTVHLIDDIVMVEGEQFADYGWRYEFTGTPEWDDDYFDKIGVTNDFGKIRDLIWTFAKAWGQEQPGELGTVIEQLTALEKQPA